MANLINCEKCGRMFQSVAGLKACSRCKNNEEDQFKAVKEYIYENPGSTVLEVAEATEVPEKKIIKFMRDGRLETKGNGMLIDCEKCGEPIASGRFCDRCNHNISMGLREAAKDVKEHMPKEKKTPKGGMYSKK